MTTATHPAREAHVDTTSPASQICFLERNLVIAPFLIYVYVKVTHRIACIRIHINGQNIFRNKHAVRRITGLHDTMYVLH